MAQIKHDTIKNDGFERIYTGYQELNDTDFRNLCLDVVKNSRSKTIKKQNFEVNFKKARTKERMLFMINNFALSGEGLGVVKQGD